MSTKRLQNKVALVTGASSGIGREVALELGRAGMKVAICARREDRLRTLAEEIGDDVLMQTVDLRNEQDIVAFFDRIRSEWGGVDVLINNAGLGKSERLVDGSTDAWREMLEVNVLGLCICTREALQDMRARGDDGHVIHISSMAAHRVPLGSGVYSATKFAVRSLTEGLRAELRALKSDIRVSAVSPGFVETEFAEVYHGTKKAAEKTYGRFKVIQPEDVANTVLHILSAPPHVQIHDVLMRPTHQAS